MLSYNTQFETSNVRNKKKLDNFHLPPIIMPQNQNQIRNTILYQYQDNREKNIMNSPSLKNDEVLIQKKRTFNLNTTSILPNINDSKNNLIYPFSQQSFNLNNLNNNNNLINNFNASGSQELNSENFDKKLNSEEYDYHLSNTDITKNQKNTFNNINENLESYILFDKQTKNSFNSPSLVRKNKSQDNININFNLKSNSPSNNFYNKPSSNSNIENTTPKIENKEMLSKVSSDFENNSKSYISSISHNLNENINSRTNLLYNSKNNNIQNEINNNTSNILLNNSSGSNINENYNNLKNNKSNTTVNSVISKNSNLYNNDNINNNNGITTNNSIENVSKSNITKSGKSSKSSGMRRKSWWDNTKNRDDEIQKIKELLRSNTELIQPDNSSSNNNTINNSINSNFNTYDNNKRSSNNTNNDINSNKRNESHEENNTKPVSAKLQRMRLIQKRNSSSHIKELLTYDDNDNRKENKLSSSKNENQNSTYSNDGMNNYINERKHNPLENIDNMKVTDKNKESDKDINNTYNINSFKENNIKNMNNNINRKNELNNANNRIDNTIVYNDFNVKKLVKKENINSSELDNFDKVMNQQKIGDFNNINKKPDSNIDNNTNNEDHYYNLVTQTNRNGNFKILENDKEKINDYNQERENKVDNLNKENDNSNKSNINSTTINNVNNNIPKYDVNSHDTIDDNKIKSMKNETTYYQDKDKINNKVEVHDNENLVELQREMILKNNPINSETSTSDHHSSSNSSRLSNLSLANERNNMEQEYLGSKYNLDKRDECNNHLSNNESEILKNEFDKKYEQSKKNIYLKDNNTKSDLNKKINDNHNLINSSSDNKSNENSFPEKTKYIQYIKHLKKTINDYKEIEKDYNQMISNLKEFQYYNKEEERLHISPSAVKLIMNYLHHYGYDHSVEVIRNETGIGANASNYNTLKQLINQREFEKAIIFTKEVYESKSTSENRFKSSYEDLLYILNKYLLLKYLQERKQDEATSLFNNYICNHIQSEIDKGGSRAEWFNKDYKLLSTLININKSTEIEKINTFFNSWNWEKEINQFWKNGFNAYRSSYNLTKGKLSQTPEEQTNIPLFAYVLAAYFLEEDDLMDTQDFQTSFKILDNINNFSKEMKKISNKNCSKLSERKMDETFISPNASSVTKNESRHNNSTENTSISHCSSSSNICSVPAGKRRIKSAGLFRSTGNLSSSNLLNERKIHSSHSTQSLNKKKSQTFINNQYDVTEYQNEKQGIINSNQFKGFVLTNDMMKPDFGTARPTRTPDSTNSYQNQYTENEVLPLVTNENETSSFTFFSCLGPMMGTIRALDIKLIPSTNRVIAVSASGDDRGDRKISLWDLNNSSLITQLDNKTSKTVLTLTFHPVWEEILLSSDMEFDVKLWNWKTGKLLKVWKKHHTRIIHKTGFIPGNYEKAISCSSDQSIKIWNVTNDDSKVSSIHSNEPFTSFTFWGDGHNQVLVASLNYSIKLYKLRTSSLLHTISLTDLKSNRTPITSITSHPIQDNFILISSDNKLLLFDLRTSTTLKTFCAREILPGQRIQGDFSPCGNYIYSGCADVKSFDSRKNYLLSSNSSMNLSLSTINNGEDYTESSLNKNNATGIFIWKLHTGKLERNDMSIMEESTIYSNVELYPVTLCKWISLNDGTDHKENINNKVLISAGVDRCLKIFSG